MRITSMVLAFSAAVISAYARGLAFESEGVKYSIPKKVVIKVGAETLYSSSKPKSWDEETDRVFRFRFDTHDFFIVGTWSSDNSVTYRLFHLSPNSKDIKQYEFISPAEDQDHGTFFVSDRKLHYWESSFCRKKTAMAFEEGSLEFVEVQMKDVPQGSCLSPELQKAKGKNKIEWKKLLGADSER